MNIVTQSLVAASIATLTLPARADIYRWTDAEGHVHFADRQPASQAAQRVETRVNTYSGVDVEHAQDIPEAATPAARAAVVMYGASWCGVCRQARDYFRQHNVPYVEYDVEQSDKGRAGYRALHGRGVPIILVGHQRMNGFDPAGFAQLYAVAGGNGGATP